MSAPGPNFSTISNPKMSLGMAIRRYTKVGQNLNYSPGRRPCPRKLEPHEVIAKLKARKTGAPA